MLIILEGPDGAGKSTLAREIKDAIGDLGVSVYHKGPATEHPLDEYETPLLGYRPGMDADIICDRWHVGEWVYPKVLDRKTQADTPTWRHLELFLAARGALIVYMLPYLEVLQERVGDDDWLIKNDQLEWIRRGYEDAIDRTVHQANTLLDFHNEIDPFRVITAARFLELEAARVKHRGSYVGPPHPHVLLVGERHEFEEPYPPAFGPYKATSGHWLLTALNPSMGLGLANANEEDLHPLWVSLERPKTVALGHVASRELQKVGVPHGAVPHPQFTRRFHHYKFSWYRSLVARAAVNKEDLLSCRPT